MSPLQAYDAIGFYLKFLVQIFIQNTLLGVFIVLYEYLSNNTNLSLVLTSIQPILDINLCI